MVVVPSAGHYSSTPFFSSVVSSQLSDDLSFVLSTTTDIAPHAAVLGDSIVMYNLLQLMANIRRIMSMQSTRAYSEARQHASNRRRQKKGSTPRLKLKRTMVKEERVGPASGPALKVTSMSTWTLALWTLSLKQISFSMRHHSFLSVPLVNRTPPSTAAQSARQGK